MSLLDKIKVLPGGLIDLGDGQPIPATPGWVIDLGASKAELRKSAAWTATRNPLGDLELRQAGGPPQIVRGDQVLLTIGAQRTRTGWHPRPDATHRCLQCGGAHIAAELKPVDWSKSPMVVGSGSFWGKADYHQRSATLKVPCGPVVAEADNLVVPGA